MQVGNALHQVNNQPKICFLICPIGSAGSDTRKRSDQFYNYVIEPVVRSLGYEPIRSDKLPKPGVITNQIINYIIDSPLVIADLTGGNPNVFYELALRHVTGKPFIQLIDEKEQVPFDTANLRTIPFNINDLNSVHSAMEEIKNQITFLEKEPHTETPISSAIKLKNLEDMSNQLKLLPNIHDAINSLNESFNRFSSTKLGESVPKSTSPSYVGATISEEHKATVGPYLEAREKLQSVSHLLEGTFDIKAQLDIAILKTAKGEFEEAYQYMNVF